MSNQIQRRLRLRSCGPCTFHRSLALYGCLLLPGLMASTGAQSTQQRAGASDTAKNEQDVRALEPSKSIERELTGGQSHVYQITLTQGQFLNVTVEQRGIDVVVKLLGPDGKQVAEFDSEIRRQGQETVSQVAEVAGSYRLNLQATQMGALADQLTGRYEIR